MKSTLSLLTVLVILVAFSTTSFAAYPRAVEKLKDGITTVMKAPLEVKDHAMAEAKDGSFLPISLPAGILKGVFYMGKQVVRGALDIATFPIDR